MNRQPLTRAERGIVLAAGFAIAVGVALVAIYYALPNDGYRLNGWLITAQLIATTALIPVHRSVIAAAHGPGPSGPPDTRPPAGPINPPPPPRPTR